MAKFCASVIAAMIQIQPMLRLNHGYGCIFFNHFTDSNTTNVKVKCMVEDAERLANYNSNTTNVKVKSSLHGDTS